ncbi:hypothetical protein F2Q68_00001360 [Brassica cretica]|uniref:TF-B3 domain-containing protein n=1 Tax=Brassica cretica TaxID=69181 RepID=A0A8S9JL75_BRACR|nr:hypothetical protein F2Q68_00001360 [Brassica cretica]
MIQDQQKLTQDLLSLIPNVVREMPPISASETDCLVSTTLCLYDPTWPKSSDDTKISCVPRGNTGTEEKENSLMKLKLLSNEGRQEEEQYGVSTELTLFTDPWTIKKKLTISDRRQEEEQYGVSTELTLFTDPWTIKKKLTISDRSRQNSHIMRYLPEVSQKMVQEGSGLTVDVYDHNTHTTHQMLLMKLTRRGSYVLSGGWLMDFVIRRALKTKDEIGIYWDLSDSKLHFCVLSRAPTRVSSGSVLAVPSQAPIEVSSGSVLAGQSQAPIEISSGSVVASPSQAPIEVSSGSVAGPSQAPIGVSSGSVTIASYSSLLADP